eukprot:454986-Rhodomonas_salina.1
MGLMPVAKYREVSKQAPPPWYIVFCTALWGGLFRDYTVAGKEVRIRKILQVVNVVRVGISRNCTV